MGFKFVDFYYFQCFENINMKVHLIKSKELPVFKFNAVCDYINSFDGEIVFKSLDYEEIENESQEYEEDAELFKLTLEDNSPQIKEDFDRFFDQCEEYRKEQSIPENELVILLTNEKNKNNFFGYPSKSMKNVFIQTSNWKDILGEGLDDVFPIVYEISAWTLRFLLFKSEGEMKTKISPKPIGCVMDMCKEKGDFSFKIRTGDISSDVMKLIQKKNINPSYMNQLISIFEKVRKGVLFRERVGITNGLSRLELRDFGKKVKLVLVDFGDLPLSFEPLETAIYLLFLKVPGGVRLQGFDSEIEIFKNILETVYTFKNDIDFVPDLIKKYTSIEQTTLLIQNISRINRKLNKVIPSNIVSKYQIDGQSGENYRISLDRNLVDLHIL